ncbi:MAG: cell envelope integrity protein CreD [Pseudomonadota bacterium]
MNRMLSGLGVRYAGVALLALLMLIPLAFVQGVADERQNYYRSVVQEVSDSWGDSLTLSGPFLVVPESFTYIAHNKAGEEVQRTGLRQRVYLPEALNIDGSLDHQYRYRAIYQVPVYQSQSRITGKFIIPSPSESSVQLKLQDARVVLGLSNTRSIEAMSPLTIADRQIEFHSGNGGSGLPGGVHAPVATLPTDKAIAFSLDLAVKGTQHYAFAPLGASTQVRLASTWPHPSFSGAYLPARFEIGDSGFAASWKIHKLARQLPASWILGSEPPKLDSSIASVGLFEPVTSYSIIDRGLKYAVLFIGLTFLAFVCFELLVPLRFHYMQFAVIGAALVLFYQTVLSLSEHIAFVVAYLGATCLLTGLIAWYVYMMTRQKALTVWAGSILVVLYSCLYILLQLQAYALLVGTAVLILGLSALMYATRGLVQYEPAQSNQAESFATLE